jgi:hypothetical protein
MGHSVIRIVNVFVIVILILILLNLLGQPISNAIPSAAQNARDMLTGLWNGIKDLVPTIGKITFITIIDAAYGLGR